ncbi:MAG: amino acid ABC transporter permease [Chloroflexi bacterium]|nr:amino acid ABC transporter permease [Chloroflexota bacterium]
MLTGGSRRPGAPAVALASTVVFFGVLGLVVVSSPGWPRVRDAFLDAEVFAAALPDVLRAFAVNVRLFLIAELLVLVLGLLLAIMRNLPGPVFFPLRLFAVVYSDVFRGLPGIAVIYVLGFGVPGLRLPGVPRDPFFWALVALTLLYTAYVAEVYRAGIESVHPSQEAAARSLGLTRIQALRFVIVPQAIRRVIPPLLNDFIGLQKDSALVSVVGVVEAFRQTQIRAAATFEYTVFLALALVFLLVTIPLARLTDWLVARDRRRQLAGGVR